jgi:hypothetical protein
MSTFDKLFANDGTFSSSYYASEYGTIVGLQYLTITIPNLSFVANHVCQFLQAPRGPH